MKILVAFVSMSIVFGFVVALFAGLAVGLGFLLAASVPGLELGHAIVAAAVIVVAAAHLFAKLMHLVGSKRDREDALSDEEPIIFFPRDLVENLPGKAKSKGKRKK